MSILPSSMTMLVPTLPNLEGFQVLDHIHQKALLNTVGLSCAEIITIVYQGEITS